jgi:hypothetical protein
MSSSEASTAKRGSRIVLAGLVVQILIFSFFVAIALVLHRRLRANPTRRSHDPSLPWKKFLYILYVASAFVMFRSIVRVAEFVEGFHGTIILHEVYLFVLDAIPMAAVMFIFNIWYPSNFLIVARKNSVVQEDATSNIELSTC